ncbi:MAG: M23 family metallopeptidase [Acidimicrobiia bacterium]
MSHKSRLARARGLALSLLMAMASFVPMLPAAASPVPPFPLRFPQETQVTQFTSTFGARRSGGRRHEGNDLMAPKMTQVFAAAAGTITVVGTSHLAGRYIEIDHGGGWTTRYIHLNNDNPGTDDGKASWSLTVAPGLVEGSRVEAGQLIAWVGDSGNAEGTGSHTHFELAYEGRAIDPFPYLQDAYRRDAEMFAIDLWELARESDIYTMI